MKKYRSRILDALLSKRLQAKGAVLIEGPYFLPHQSHSYGYAPSSGENLTSKIYFKSDATYYFHIT